ncbi:MAG: Rubredoxin-type Fe(Cys)4 protein [uncultured bacterium]|nr:MAG: Rubredoxin-type Fe(Cys)4 protein [uncultured bacterium]HBH17808.1 hypothetical protein [Cyanobacteria bacterium UBA9579]
MKSWRCTVCGYIHQGDTPPEQCPRCKAPKEKFVEIIESSDSIHISYAQKTSNTEEVNVVPFFEDYESLAPFIYNLPAGKEVQLHKHPTTDELFYIIKGKLQFKVGEETIGANPGDLIQGKMNIPHTFKNIGDEPAAFLSVKGPKPVDLEMIGE